VLEASCDTVEVNRADRRGDRQEQLQREQRCGNRLENVDSPG